MNDKKPTLKYFNVFGAKCYVLNDGDDRRGKFEAKAHETVFVRYSRRSYSVYIFGQHQVKESVNITFDDTKLPNIQTEDATDKIKVNNLLDPDSDDDDTQPEIVADGNDVNNDDDHCDGDGNIDFNDESIDTSEKSSRNLGKNSGGDNGGSTSHSYDILDFRVSINKCYVFSCYCICVGLLFLLDESLMSRLRG